KRCLHFGRHDKSASPARTSSVLLDKLGPVDPAAGVFAIPRTDEGCDEFVHFEMQMGKVTTVGGTNSRNLLVAFHGFAGMNEHILNMTVIRLHIFAFVVIDVSVEQNNHVSPSRTAIARKHDASVSNL